MRKLGTITDGISRDFEYALDVMVETGLEYVELQYLWKKQVGDLTDRDLKRVQEVNRGEKFKGIVYLTSQFVGNPGRYISSRTCVSCTH